ncbi:MAG: hypothetical protein LBG52_08870 [Candidatus Peribacteria bacterium]|jgi:hypothetical protein|nr:hypothetical protein [Candidatus Peribacteria bacterium]
MVLLSFSLSIAIYTIWLNATLGILISLVMCGMLAIGVGGWLFFRQKRRDPSYFFKHWAISCLWIVVGNVLALVMVCGNLRWKGGNYLQQFQGTCCEEAPVTFSVFN